MYESSVEDYILSTKGKWKRIIWLMRKDFINPIKHRIYNIVAFFFNINRIKKIFAVENFKGNIWINSIFEKCNQWLTFKIVVKEVFQVPCNK